MLVAERGAVTWMSLTADVKTLRVLVDTPPHAKSVAGNNTQVCLIRYMSPSTEVPNTARDYHVDQVDMRLAHRKRASTLASSRGRDAQM